MTRPCSGPVPQHILGAEASWQDKSREGQGQEEGCRSKVAAACEAGSAGMTGNGCGRAAGEGGGGEAEAEGQVGYQTLEGEVNGRKRIRYDKLGDGREAKESKASEDNVVAFNVGRPGCFVWLFRLMFEFFGN